PPAAFGPDTSRGSLLIAAQCSAGAALHSAPVARLEPRRENVPQHDRVVVLLVARGAEEGHVAAAAELAERFERRAVALELRLVPLAKLLPPVHGMTEPFAQLRARRDVLQPIVERGLLLAQTARPDSIHENPASVGCGGLVVYTLDLDMSLPGHLLSFVSARTGYGSMLAFRRSASYARRRRLAEPCSPCHRSI